MTLQSDILNAVAVHWAAADSLRVPITYVQPGVTTYAPGTGSASTGDQSFSLRGLFFDFTETDGEEVRPTDRRLELDPNDVSFVPRAQQDHVTSPDPADPTALIREEVHALLRGPTGVSIVLHMRRAA